MNSPIPTLAREYYAATLPAFLAETEETILGHLTKKSDFAIEQAHMLAPDANGVTLASARRPIARGSSKQTWTNRPALGSLKPPQAIKEHTHEHPSTDYRVTRTGVLFCLMPIRKHSPC